MKDYFGEVRSENAPLVGPIEKIISTKHIKVGSKTLVNMSICATIHSLKALPNLYHSNSPYHRCNNQFHTWNSTPKVAKLITLSVHSSICRYRLMEMTQRKRCSADVCNAKRRKGGECKCTAKIESYLL